MWAPEPAGAGEVPRQGAAEPGARAFQSPATKRLAALLCFSINSRSRTRQVQWPSQITARPWTKV